SAAKLRTRSGSTARRNRVRPCQRRNRPPRYRRAAGRTNSSQVAVSRYSAFGFGDPTPPPYRVGCFGSEYADTKLSRLGIFTFGSVLAFISSFSPITPLRYKMYADSE